MKNRKITMASIAFLASATFVPEFANAQHSGVSRHELQRHDMGTPGIEARQVAISFDEGTAFGNHKHPGEEIIYVLEGVFEYEVAGKPVIVKAGETLFIPAGTVHAAKNVGTGKATELATYIVEKGKKLVEPAN